MKKIIVSLLVAATLVMGTVGTAVAITAHNHECGNKNEICRTYRHQYQCSRCGKTRVIQNSNPYAPYPPSCHGPMIYLGSF